MLPFDFEDRVAGVKIVFDKFLKPGQCFPLSGNYWAVGVGTDINAALFDASLTARDRRFLASLKIAI